MWISLCSGKDSFRAQNVYPKRNVQVLLHTYSSEGDDGKNIVPVFVAFKKKLKGFGESHLISTIPATDKFDLNDAGQWFDQRYEVMPGTEILIEYRKRDNRGFGENIEYLMLKAQDDAPLWRSRLDLPNHPLSSVPCVFFEGRYNIVDADQQISKASIDHWRRHLGLDAEFDVSDLLDPNQDAQVFQHVQNEAAPRKMINNRRVGKVVKIKRGRKIRT